MNTALKYSDVAVLETQESNLELFLNKAELAIKNFIIGNKTATKIDQGAFNTSDYHKMLLSLFHQVYFSSTSFALAGANLDPVYQNAKEYLFHHAEEEMTHWRWILNDLEGTGYRGNDPRSLFPKPSTQAYLSYGVFLGQFFPLGRLAMGFVLEGISARFGSLYGAKIMQQLSLKKEQVSFFLSHGDLDQGHTNDIIQLLKTLDLDKYTWAKLTHVACCTGLFYKEIYNSLDQPLFDVSGNYEY